MLLGQWDIFTLVGPLDFVGTGGGWQWVVVVDGNSGGISLFPNIFVQLFIIYCVINTNKCNACVSI